MQKNWQTSTSSNSTRPLFPDWVEHVCLLCCISFCRFEDILDTSLSKSPLLPTNHRISWLDIWDIPLIMDVAITNAVFSWRLYTCQHKEIAKVDWGPSDTHHGYSNTMAERHCATRESDARLGEFHPLPRRSTTHASWKLVCCKRATIILSWHSWAVIESPPLPNTASGV